MTIGGMLTSSKGMWDFFIMSESHSRVMTLKEACQLAYDLWLFLYLNPGKGKEDWDRFEEIEKMENWCPLCEIYNNHERRRTHNQCFSCVGNIGGYCFDRAFSKWIDTHYNYKAAAGYILSKIRRFMKKNGWNFRINQSDKTKQQEKVNNLIHVHSVKIVYSDRFNGEPVGEIVYDPNSNILTGFYVHRTLFDERTKLKEMEGKE